MSQHFSRTEFACHCCGRLQVDSHLIEGLEALRALAGMPVVINAGYRCPRHNQEVGGVPNSEHTRRLAADIRLAGLSLQQTFDLATQVPQFAQGGIGAYDENFLHVDVRGHRARWARVHGHYVGIDQLVGEPQLLAEKTGTEHAGHRQSEQLPAVC